MSDKPRINEVLHLLLFPGWEQHTHEILAIGLMFGRYAFFMEETAARIHPDKQAEAIQFALIHGIPIKITNTIKGA